MTSFPPRSPLDDLRSEDSRSQPPPVGRGFSLTASWTVIILATVVMFAINQVVGRMAAPAGGEDPIGIRVMELQSRALIAQKQAGGDARSTYNQARLMLYTGPIGQRLRFVVLAGELAGPEEALNVLDDLEQRVALRDDVRFDEKSASARDVLRTLYSSYAAGDFEAAHIGEDDLALIRQELDWFGDLALTPEGTASETARDSVLRSTRLLTQYMLFGGILAAGVAFAGVAALIAFVVLAAVGVIRSRIGPPLVYDHIYAETFAVWMIVLFGLMLVSGLIPVPPEFQLIVTLAVFFGSLSALAWPIIRGVPAGTMLRDVGLNFRAARFYEPILGIASYIMTLPLLAVGLGLTFLLMHLHGLFAGTGDPAADFSPTGGGAHPIVEFIGGGNVFRILQVYLLAAVAAPIVEETMFRGVLYRHLRSMSARRGLFLSISFSVLLNAFIFALIHPQTWMAMPALMSLAIGMSLAREYCGTLIAPMMVHGISNGLVVTLMLILFS